MVNILVVVGYEVIVVCFDWERFVIGYGLIFYWFIWVGIVEDVFDFCIKVWFCFGIFVDCVKFVFYVVMFCYLDFVFFGVNYGVNFGIDVLYFGIVFVVMEGLIEGIFSIVLSLVSFIVIDF